MHDEQPGVDRPTIAELLATADRPLISFEFFPPKDDAGEAQLWRTMEALEPTRPDFISVTYGANGSNRERTIRLTERLGRHLSLRTVGHLTVADQPVEQLRHVLDDYWRSGVRHVLAVRGDPPGGPTAAWTRHPDGLDNATQLVRLARERRDFCVGVGAFPDGHPEHGDVDLDARILRDKADAGASFAITQLFFTPARYGELVARVRDLGCLIPIIPGIMPVTNIRQIERFAELSGAALPEAVVARLSAVADDPQRVREVGIDIATEQCAELLDSGAPGLHFFTQNRSRATTEVLARLQAARRH